MFQIQQIEQIVGRSSIKKQEPLKKHTTFRIGGPVSYYIEPATTEEFVNVVRYLREQKEAFRILGNGSNILVGDEGLRCIVIATFSGKKGSLEADAFFKKENPMRNFFFQEGYCSQEEIGDDKILVYAGSGCLLSKLANDAAKESLQGLEFAGGIPGTVGGAVVMNAGAYDGEIKDVLLGVRVLDQNGQIRILKAEELDLSYRHSIIEEEGFIVLDALFALEEGEEEKIREKMQDFNQRRKEKQPLEYGSAGSTFKRPEGYFAGKLIQDAGLRGYRCGDVMVSEKHCGFVVNVGNGSCEEAKEVISHVQKTVQEKFGVVLETEVKYW